MLEIIFFGCLVVLVILNAYKNMLEMRIKSEDKANIGA